MEERAPQAESACGSYLSNQPVLADLPWTTYSDTQTATAEHEKRKDQQTSGTLSRKKSPPMRKKKSLEGLENERQKT